MTTTNPLTTLWGKIARVPLLKRGQQQKRRFLCPNCLHFGGFAFACGECWAELHGYADGQNTEKCRCCQQSLLSADGESVRAYCQHCKGNCDRAIYHQREVRVLATLRTADSQSLHRAISGQEYQPQGGKGYVYDDGEWLAYVLNLSDFTDEAHAFPPTYALWEAQSIWLDMSASNPKQLALEWGEAADRFIRQAKLTVCVQQAEANVVVKPVLETHFGKIRYGVTVPVFLLERTRAKAVALEEIGHDSTVPALIVAFKNNDEYLRHEKYFGILSSRKASDEDLRRKATEALVRIGKLAVPALIAALKDSHNDVRSRALWVLGQIGDAPALIVALKDIDRNVRSSALWVLGQIGDAAAVPALSEALKDTDVGVRWSAAEALEKIGDDAAVPALEAADRKNHRTGYCPFCSALRRSKIT